MIRIDGLVITSEPTGRVKSDGQTERTCIWACNDCRGFQAYPTMLFALPESFCPECFRFSRRYEVSMLRKPSYTRPGKLLIRRYCARCETEQERYGFLPLLDYGEFNDDFQEPAEHQKKTA